MPIVRRTFLAPLVLVTAANIVLAIYVHRQDFDLRPLDLGSHHYEHAWWVKLALTPWWIRSWVVVGVVGILALRDSPSLAKPVVLALVLAAAGLFTFIVAF